MIYESWYQGSWWLFILFAVLCGAILWRWTTRLAWPWQLLVVGTPLIAFVFPTRVDADVPYLAPAFIQFGFELVDSGFSLSDSWPFYQLPVLVMVVWAIGCIGLAFAYSRRSTNKASAED